jgi:hypothetical protein
MGDAFSTLLSLNRNHRNLELVKTIIDFAYSSSKKHPSKLISEGLGYVLDVQESSNLIMMFPLVDLKILNLEMQLLRKLSETFTIEVFFANSEIKPACGIMQFNLEAFRA